MKNWIIAIGTVFALAVIGGITYKSFFAPTSRTVIGKGGKQVIINTDSPKIPLFSLGCSNLQAEAYWKKQRLFSQFKEKTDDKGTFNIIDK